MSGVRHNIQVPYVFNVSDRASIICFFPLSSTIIRRVIHRKDSNVDLQNYNTNNTQVKSVQSDPT